MIHENSRLATKTATEKIIKFTNKLEKFCKEEGFVLAGAFMHIEPEAFKECSCEEEGCPGGAGELFVGGAFMNNAIFEDIEDIGDRGKASGKMLETCKDGFEKLLSRMEKGENPMREILELLKRLAGK